MDKNSIPDSNVADSDPTQRSSQDSTVHGRLDGEVVEETENRPNVIAGNSKDASIPTDISSGNEVDANDVKPMSTPDSGVEHGARNGSSNGHDASDGSTQTDDVGDSGAAESDSSSSDGSIDSPDSGLDGEISRADSSEQCCERVEPSIACGYDLVCSGENAACVIELPSPYGIDTYRYHCAFTGSTTNTTPECIRAEDCEEGHICNMVSGKCELECDDSGGCPPDMVCLTASNICRPESDMVATVIYLCDDAADCSEDHVCCDGYSKGPGGRMGGRCQERCGPSLYDNIQLCSTDAECNAGTCSKPPYYFHGFCGGEP